MRYANFIGTSYTPSTVLADAERLVNWWYEPVQSPGAKSPAILIPSPGFSSWASTMDVSGRALRTMNGRMLGVIGFGAYGFDANATPTKYGTVDQDANPAQIEFNGKIGNQALFCSGGTLRLLNLATNVLTTPTFPGVATQIGMIDGYFVVFDATNSRIWLSNINDGGTYDPTQFATRTDAPDNWKAMVVNAPDIWLIGERTGGVWYDSGAFPFPLAPRPGVQFKYGIAAPFSIAAAGNSVLWLSQTNEGAGIVVRTLGYQPQRISNYALESAIASYQLNFTIANAESFVFQFAGHTFYVLTFPDPNKSWCYDLDTGRWSELTKWSSPNNREEAWFPRVHTFAFGKHLTADRSSGTVSWMDTSFGTELDGSAIRRVRRAPGTFDEHRQVPLRNVEIYLEAAATVSGQGRDPVILWRSSKDGGRTFGNERQIKTGQIGVYKRARIWRLGAIRDRVNEMVVSDPVPWKVVDAFVNNDTGGGGKAA